MAERRSTPAVEIEEYRTVDCRAPQGLWTLITKAERGLPDGGSVRGLPGGSGDGRVIRVSSGVLAIEKRVEQHHAGERNRKPLGSLHLFLAKIGNPLFHHRHPLLQRCGGGWRGRRRGALRFLSLRRLLRSRLSSGRRQFRSQRVHLVGQLMVFLLQTI